jgi:hypothetical protein
MPETRIPVSKPKAVLEQVYEYHNARGGGEHVIGFKTAFGKFFEREECPGRGVVWYQLVKQ